VKRILALLFLLQVPSLSAQAWWGNFTSANDTYTDAQVGESVAFRFVAPWSGAVTAVAFPVTQISALPLSDTGTAGLHADDGTGHPAGVALGSAPATLAQNWNRVLLPDVSLSAGATYHLVYTVGTTTVRFKLGDLYNDRWIPSSASVNDAWNWLYYPTGGPWFVTMHDPAFLLEFADGSSYGNPYNDNSPILNLGIGGGAPLLPLHDGGTPGVPSDDACAGQVFRTPGSGVCLARGFELKEFAFTTVNAPLQWTLEEAASGFDVVSGTVVPSSLLWLPVTFTSPVTLWSQSLYRLWFKAAQPTTSPYYPSCAWHTGSGAVWSGLTWQGTTGRAQSSPDGGATWVDHANGDLAFRMDIDTSPLPQDREAPSLWMSSNRLFQGEILTFRIETVEEGNTTLVIYNSAGEKVKEVLRESMPQGTVKDVTWDGKTETGEVAASGLYMAHLSSPRRALTYLFIVLR
jgi:hypothetical protein